MPIAIRSWQRHQRSAIAKILRIRRDRGLDFHAPYSRPQFTVSSSFDRDFLRFAAICASAGIGGADGLWLRVLQYAATTSGLAGDIDVEREMFGPIVLSRSYGVVDADQGAKAYDALLESGLCQAVTGECKLCHGGLANRDTANVRDNGSGAVHSLCAASVSQQCGTRAAKKKKKEKKKGSIPPSSSPSASKKGAETPPTPTPAEAAVSGSVSAPPGRDEHPSVVAEWTTEQWIEHIANARGGEWAVKSRADALLREKVRDAEWFAEAIKLAAAWRGEPKEASA